MSSTLLSPVTRSGWVQWSKSKWHAHAFTPLVIVKLMENIRLASIDSFIAKLWEIHETVKAEGYVQVGIIS